MSNSAESSTQLKLTIGELHDGLAGVLEPAHDVGQTRCSPEVLLFETELFADWRMVMKRSACIGVQIM